MKLYRYTTNNSGGGWWLDDMHWKALEQAGWRVDWVAQCPHLSTYDDVKKTGRWLGTLAKSASKEFPSFAECVEEFEALTDQDVTDDGCSCCGPPHGFFEGGEYIGGGKDLVGVLYPEAEGATLRELAERNRKAKP